MAPLCEVAEWGDYTPNPPPANAATLLNAASGVVRSYSGWQISAEHIRGQRVDGDGSSVLMLPTLRLTAVTSVAVEERRLARGRDYTWSAAGVIRRLPPGHRWPQAHQAIAASYRHGYDPVPAEIKAIAVSLAARTATVPAGLVQQTVGAITYRWAEGVTSIGLAPGEKAVLNRYRLP